MKKISLLLSFTVLIIFSSFAKEVDLATATTVAKTFYSTKATISNMLVIQNLQCSLGYKCSLPTSNAISGSKEEVIYYIFNINKNDGFVIIAADDIITPVLGYSNKGSYDGNHMPPAFKKWMENYKEQILFARQHNFKASDEIKSSWNELLKADNTTNYRLPGLLIVNPLCTTTWDQGNNGGYYNASCPADASLPDNNNTSTHCVTGCPATAMAQIMKYWNYPANGSGFHSYNHPVYGTLSSNFGNTTFNWAAMPLNVTSNNAEVANLMFQCGVSVDMQYSPDESGGYVIINSPTPTACCEYAYKTYFGYNPATIQGLKRSDYTDTDWKNLLKNELTHSRLVQYAGFGTGGGHTFVCDGFDMSDFFHMNWGWSGFYDGFFAIDALNPGGLGAGGGTGGYNGSQQAIIGIQPVSTGGASQINLYSSITVTPNPIGFAQAFTVNADVINAGTSNFSGDYCGAIFSSDGNFIDYVQIISASTSPLQPGYHYTGGLNFTNAGLLSVPGSYNIGIYYRDAGGNWNLAGNATYTNPISVSIQSPIDYINQYSPIVATPTTFIQGEPASVNVNIINNNTLTYYGEYSAVLYDLNGNFVQTIGTYTETTGLPSGYTYLAPYLTFSTSAITASPGTYILAIEELENGFPDWHLVGGVYYSTPVNIDVVAPLLSPDIYENNNTQAQAYNLPLNWVNNNAHPLTTGSNIHTNTDVDFYKIMLAAGYSYTITARAHDSYNSGNGNTYTEDVLWSYNDGTGWSLAYDDIMTGDILVNGAGTVSFQVAPFFIGQIGTYLLDISINRTPASGITDLNYNNVFDIYPNPASSNLNVKLSTLDNVQQLKVLDGTGQTVLAIKPTQATSNIDLSTLSNGVYMLEVINNDNTSKIRKFIINR